MRFIILRPAASRAALEWNLLRRVLATPEMHTPHMSSAVDIQVKARASTVETHAKAFFGGAPQLDVELYGCVLRCHLLRECRPLEQERNWLAVDGGDRPLIAVWLVTRGQANDQEAVMGK